MDLQHAMEVEVLHARLEDGQLRYSQLQTYTSLNFEALMRENKKVIEENTRLKDRYDRLLESNKKLQKNNHHLESKLITAIENISEEKQLLWKDLSKQTSKLMDAKLLIADLYEALEKYRIDCNLALQLLQCRPSSPPFQSIKRLPLELQERIKEYLPTSIKKSISSSSLHNSPFNPIFPTFPPTATFYSHSAAEEDTSSCIPTSAIVELLSKPQNLPERTRKILLCHQCLHHRVFVDHSSQTTETHLYHFSHSRKLQSTVHHI